MIDKKGLSPLQYYEKLKCVSYPEDSSKNEKKNTIIEILKGGQLPILEADLEESSPSTISDERPSVPPLTSVHGPEQTKYFIEAKKEGAVEMNLGKVMVMGREGAGKSCLIGSFLGLTFNPEHEITDCIAGKTVVSKTTDEWKEKSGDDGAAGIYEDGVAHIITRKTLDLKEGNYKEERTTTLDDQQLSCESAPQPIAGVSTGKSTGSSNKKKRSLFQRFTEVFQQMPSKSSRNQFTAKEDIQPFHTMGLLTKSTDEHISTLQEVPKNIQKKIEESLKKKQTLGRWHKANDGTFNILDFGGQLVYKGVQRIIIVSQAIYLVVFNLEDDLNSFAVVQDSSKEWHTYHMTHLEIILYWIRTIYSDTRARDQDTGSDGDLPAVYIIGTHYGSTLLGKDVNERKQKAESKISQLTDAVSRSPFEAHVRGYYLVDNTLSSDDENVVELKKVLEKQMSKMVKTVPLKWVHVQSEIQKLSERKVTIPLKQMNELSRKCGISDEETQLTLLDYLDDLGEIIFIRTIEALRHTVVINPMSLVRYCRAIFTVIIPDLQTALMKKSWRKLDKGILEEKLLRFLWENIVDDLDENFDFLVKLMERIGLLCERKISTKSGITERSFYAPLRLKPITGQRIVTENYGIRAVSVYHDFCGYLPDEIFPQTVTRFIEKFQVEGKGDPELAHEYAELYLDQHHHVIFSVVTIKQRRMFKTTILRGKIINEDHTTCEPAPAACKEVLSFMKTAFEMHNVNDRRGINVKLCITCPCNRDTEHMQVLTDLKEDMLPCGRDRVRITRYQRLFGDRQEDKKGSILDDRQLLEICNTLDCNWRRLGIKLGLSQVEIQKLAYDCKQEKDKMMAMLVSWRNQQAADVNQVSMMIDSLNQQGYTSIAEQLRGDFKLPANFPGFLHDNDLMFIIDEIGVTSSKVAIHLGLTWDEVSLAKSQHRSNSFETAMTLFTTWRKRQLHTTNQLQLMCRALEKERLTSVAQQLRNNVEPESDLTKGCLDDKTLLCICDEMKSDWKLVGVQLGLELSEIDRLDKDHEDVKTAIMKMLVIWKKRQPSNVNQLNTMCSALTQRGYVNLSDNLKANLNPPELYTEHQPLICALCGICYDEGFEPDHVSKTECRVDEAEFKDLLNEISSHLDDDDDLRVLKVALTDHIPEETRYSANCTTELLDCLVTQNMLRASDLHILLEVIKITGFKHLHRFIKGCPQLSDISITSFSRFRQSIVAFGRTLTNSYAKEIALDFDADVMCTDKWALIMKLETDRKLWNNEQSIREFKAKFENHVC